MPDKKKGDCGCGFGKKIPAKYLKTIKKDGKKIPAKYSPSSGRKSPPVSATIYSVGFVKRGLDNNNWVIVQSSNGVKRWKKTKFGKKKVRCKTGSIPVNKKLYSRILSSVKKSVKTWPSAYASGQVVNKYVREGGKYKCKGNAMGSFYKQGAENALFLTPQIRQCLSLVYGPRITESTFRFGKQREPIGLNRWFKEKWVNVCKRKSNGTYSTCAKSSKKYPYCRPSVRVTSKTPKTVHEISKSKLKILCKRKKSSKRISIQNK